MASDVGQLLRDLASAISDGRVAVRCTDGTYPRELRDLWHFEDKGKYGFGFDFVGGSVQFIEGEHGATGRTGPQQDQEG